MKFDKLILGILGLGLTMSSCNLDSDENDITQVYTLPCCNLVIPDAGDAFASQANYSLTFFYTTGKISVATNNLSLGAGNVYNFQTSNMPFTTDLYPVGNGTLGVNKFSGGYSSGTGITIQDFQGYTSTIINAIETDPDKPMTSIYKWTPYTALVMSYKANYDYTVKTFMADAVYNGKTTVVTVGDPSDPYVNTTGLYRIIFSQDLKKADIVFYNSQFHPMMPAQDFVVKNLAVIYSKSGYTIQIPEGTEYIVPERPEGQTAVLVPYEPYRFTSCTFTPSSSDLTEGVLSFNLDRISNGQVTGQFRCTFEGAYAYTEPQTTE